MFAKCQTITFYLFFVLCCFASLSFEAPTELSIDDNYECLQFDDDDSSTNSLATEDEKRDWLYGSKTPYLRAREEILRLYSSNSSRTLEENNCEPVYLYFLSRHSIRYPAEKEIKAQQKLLPRIAKQLAKSDKLSQEVVEQLKRWRFTFHGYEDEHVSLSGAWQEEATAKIFYEHFPNFLDIQKRNFEVAVSLKPRTEETANAFIRSLVEIQTPDQLNLTYDKAQDQIDDVVAEKFYPIEKNEMLQTHSRCNKIKNGPPWPSPEYLELLKTQTFTDLAREFSKRFGLSPALSIQDVQLVHKMCAYEMSLYGQSVWFELFTNQEWKALTFLVDFNSYSESYGYELYRKESCVAILDLHTKLKSIVDNKVENNTTLYFSHDTFIKRLYAFLEMFNQTPPIYKLDHSERVCIPKAHTWNTSVIMPFGSNIAVSLHKCHDQKLKLLTQINEVQMEIKGCANGFCDVEQFLNEFENLAHMCDIDKLCPRS